MRGFRPYQRRRKAPVLVVVAVLAMLALTTWTTVLLHASGPAGGATCPPPAAGTPPGESLPAGGLDGVAPVAPGAVRVRVLNAGGQRGQANLVAAQLGDLGFARAGAPDNDPLYPDGDMRCTAQIRFGAAGEGAASTVALVLPCAEPVRDGRADDSVDVSVGTAFRDLNPVRAVKEALAQLAAPAAGTDGAGNADPAASDSGPPPPPSVDPTTLKAVQDATC